MSRSESARHDRFVIEYASGSTAADAARAAGIATATAFRWLDREDVRADIEHTRADIRRRTVDILADASAEAARVLLDIATDPERSDTARVSAARAILAESRTYVEVEELRQRIDRIERDEYATTTRDTIRALLTETDAA